MVVLEGGGDGDADRGGKVAETAMSLGRVVKPVMVTVRWHVGEVGGSRGADKVNGGSNAYVDGLLGRGGGWRWGCRC